MISVPVSLSPDVRVPCGSCGDLLHQIADERADEFAWAGEDGSRTGTDSDLRQLEAHGGAYARLAWLGDEMDRLHKLSRKRKGEYVWPDERMRAEYHARGREYSALKVRLEFGTFHIHRARESDVPPYQGPPVSHCDYPAWLRPSGWRCRRCGKSLNSS